MISNTNKSPVKLVRRQIEEILTDIKEGTSTKLPKIAEKCLIAKNLLLNLKDSETEIWKLREIVLEPIKLALESKNNRLTILAIAGIQSFMNDERFYSTNDFDHEDCSMIIQLIDTVNCAFILPEETQMEIMKLLLAITCSSKSIITSRVVIKVSEFCLELFNKASKRKLRKLLSKIIIRMFTYHKRHSLISLNAVSQVCLDSYSTNSGGCVRTAIRATLTQLLTALTNKLKVPVQSIENSTDDSNIKKNFDGSIVSKENDDFLARDLVTVLCFLSAKLQETLQDSPSLHLLLEALLSILSNLTVVVGHRKDFVNLTWKNIIPCLIKFLCNPATDKLISRDENGQRGCGYSSTNSTSLLSEQCIKTVYNIAIEFIRIVGDIHSLRAPLASLLHRIYLYSPPSSRLEALKCLTIVVNSPIQLLHLSSPTVNVQRSDDKQNLYEADLLIIKIIGQSLKECCLSKDSTIILTCVSLMCQLVKCVNEICKGVGICDKVIQNTLLPINENNEEKFPLKCNENLTSWKNADDKSISSTDSEDLELLTKAQLYERKDILESFRFEMDESERENARLFIDKLKDFLSCKISEFNDEREFDNELLIFSSQFVKDTQFLNIILNADAIYVTTYYTLFLNLSLLNCGYYESQDVIPDINQIEFCDEILNCGLLLYVSQVWLEEIYMQIIRKNILDNNTTNSSMLINLITNIDHKCLNKQAQSTVSLKFENDGVKIGREAAKKILTTIGSDIINVLSTLVTGSNCVIGLGESLALLFNAKEENKKVRDAICSSLDALRVSARLAYELGLENLCVGVVTSLTDASCRLIYDGETRLHTAQALSLDTILSIGIEIGSHSIDCWQNIFRCCEHVAFLEHRTFAKSDKLTKTEDNILNNVSDLVKHSSSPSAWKLDANIIGGSDILSAELSAKALCGLSQQVDKTFQQAIEKLSLKDLISFVNQLCKSSRQQMINRKTWNAEKLSANVLFVYRLGDILLGLVDSNRPLLHFLRCWTIGAAHLVEVACEKECDVSKKSVELMYSIVSHMIINRCEYDFFHIHEALCKPFENILSLELCNDEMQDQVVCSLCSLVESASKELKSGWSSVFGALKSIKLQLTTVEEINSARIGHLTAVLDVFNAFLSTDDPNVFSQASIDCILCLLHYIKTDFNQDLSDSDDEEDDNEEKFSLGEPALKYLIQCTNLLAKMKLMPNCPIFNGANRIQFTKPSIVDDNFSSIILESYEEKYECKTNFFNDFIKKLSIEESTNIKNLNDAASGVLHVWSLMFESLIDMASNCIKQPKVITILFELLRETIKIDHRDFGLHVINHLILPQIQIWVRRGDESMLNLTNLRQCIGLLSDFVVETIVELINEVQFENILELTLKQLLDVLIECIWQPIEQLSRVGTACMRHSILSVGALFTEPMWHICCVALTKALNLSLLPLRQILAPFDAHSDNFYGDIGSVKIAVRCDGSAIDAERLRSLAQQVFLIKEQRSKSKPIDYSLDTDRSFIFLLEPPNSQIFRLPFSNIVIGLIAHQQLIQLVSSITLPGDLNVLKFSTRNVLLLLEALKNSQKISEAFDSRPGLKFLVQKVSRADVASNLYTNSTNAIQLRVKILVHILSNFDNLSVQKTKIWIQNNSIDQDCYVNVGKLSDNSATFAILLRETIHELCTSYVDLYIDKYIPSIVDKLSSTHNLFFLLADDSFESIAELKREKSIKEMVAEKLLEVSPPATPINVIETFSDEEQPRKIDGKVYSVATQSKISNLMSEYKKRKQQHTLPIFQKQERSKPQPIRKPRPKTDKNDREKEIDNEQNESLIKDSDAALTCWVTAICETLSLFEKLSDDKFKAMLPLVISSVTQLICHSRDARLRESLANWTHRVAVIYGFSVND